MKTQLNIDFSKLTDQQMSNIIDIFAEQHGKEFDNMTKYSHTFSLAIGGTNSEEKQNPIYVVASETLRLIPLGNFGFTFTKNSRMTRQEPIYGHDVDTSGERLMIPKTEGKRLMKLMRKHKTDVFTDGHDFYTTYGEECIGKINHPRFREQLEIENEKIHELLYG